MNPFFRSSILATALALALPTAALAQNASDLPEARELVQRHIDAMGGEARVLTASQGTSTGTFSMPAANLNAPMRMAADGKGNVAGTVELPGMGNIQNGIGNGIVWAMDPFQGPRILQGAEAAQQTDTLSPDGMLRKDSKVSNMRTTGREEFDGKACYRVEVTWRSGRESWDCYGTDDGRLLASGGKVSSPAGETEMVTIVQQYEERGGIPMPVRSEMRMMGQSQIITVESFDPTAPDPAVFELPAAIKALADQ